MPVKPAPTSTLVTTAATIGESAIFELPLNEGYGTTTASGGGSTAETVTIPASAGITWGNDASGGYLAFTANSLGFLTLPTPITLGAGSAYTIVFRANETASNSSGGIFGSTATQVWGRLDTGAFKLSNGLTWTVPGGTVASHDYVVSTNGTNTSLYVDGTLVSTQGGSLTLSITTLGEIYIGFNSAQLAGRLDYFGVYARAWSSSDATANSADWTARYTQPSVATTVTSSYADPYGVTIAGATGQTIRAPLTVKPALNGRYTGTVTLTPSGGGISTPLTYSYTNNVDQPSQTVTPTTAGTITWTVTNNQSLANTNGTFAANADPAKPGGTPTILPYRPRAPYLLHQYLAYEGSGTTLHDIVAVGTVNGTFSGALTWSTSSLGTGATIASASNSRFVNLASNLVIPSPFSVLWNAGLTSNGAQGGILGRNDANADNIRMQGPSSGVTVAFGGGSTVNIATSQNFSTPSNWALTYDGTTLLVYRDALLVGSSGYSGSRSLTVNALLRAVNNNPALDFTGAFSFCHIFSRVLTGAEVLAEHNDPFLVNRADATVYQAGAFSVTGIAATRIDLAMAVATNGTGPYTYQLQNSTDGLSWSDLGSALTAQTGAAAWTDSGLTVGTLHYYRVKVTDAVSTFVYSGIVSATTAALTIALTTPANKQAVQVVTDGGANRAAPVCGGTTGPLDPAGTYSGGVPLGLQYSLDNSTWFTLADRSGTGTIAGGTFSRTLNGVAQGDYTFRVRATNDNAAAASAVIRIGEFLLDYGQSNMQGPGDVPQTYVATGGIGSSIYRLGGGWGDNVDPTGGFLGSFVPHLCARLSAILGKPVSSLNAAIAGQALVYDDGAAQPTLRPPNGDGRGHNNWTPMVNAITASNINAIRAVIFNQGESDIQSGMTSAAYLAGLQALATACAAFRGAPPLFVSQVCYNPLGGPVIQGELAYRTASSTGGGTLFFLDTEIHPQSAGDPDPILVYAADCFALAINEKLFAGPALSGRGPVIVSATFNGAKTQTTIVFDRPLKAGDTLVSGLWTMADSNGALAVSAVAYHGSNTSALILTHAASAGTSPTVSYGYGVNPVSAADPSAVAVIHNLSAGTAFTAATGTNLITSAAHGLANGSLIAVANSGGALPGGLVALKAYFVVNATTNTFQLALSGGGSPIVLTTTGSGTNTWSTGASGGSLGSGAGAVKGAATTLAAPTGFPSSVAMYAEPFSAQAISAAPAASTDAATISIDLRGAFAMSDGPRIGGTLSIH